MEDGNMRKCHRDACCQCNSPKPGHVLQTAANAEKSHKPPLGIYYFLLSTCFNNPNSLLHIFVQLLLTQLILIKVRIKCCLQDNVLFGI